MPGRYYGRKRNYTPRAIINSITNRVNFAIGSLGATQSVIIAKAVTSPAPTVNSDVSHGCIIQMIYVVINGCGLGGTGVINDMDLYIIKNPGNNLTNPAPISVGTSNEKKFVFKTWKFMIMRNQDGNVPFHWEGWVKVPKKYQRMGTDDVIYIVVANTASLTGHFSGLMIYKWKR